MVSIQKKHAQQQSGSPEEIVEKGDIYFVYRPRVEEREAEGLGDVQRFYMVMKREGQALFRVTVLGRKRLPESKDHERIWGFLESVAKQGRTLENEFREHQYETNTRGKRTLPSARPAGEGVRALVQRGRNLHLTYELELPEKRGEVQEELNIERQAAYILSIRNPEVPSPPGAGLPGRDEAHYPKPLKQEFHGRRFASDDPRLLDYEGAEFILVGARTDLERAYDIDIQAEHETANEADIFRQLRCRGASIPPSRCCDNTLCISGVTLSLTAREIPVAFTKDGRNISPPFGCSDLPAGTCELTLISKASPPSRMSHGCIGSPTRIPPISRACGAGFEHQHEPEEPLHLYHGKNSLDGDGYQGPQGTLGRTFRYRIRRRIFRALFRADAAGFATDM